MTRYVTQWDAATINAGLPTGWTRRWQAAIVPSTAVVDLVYKRLLVKRRAVSYGESGSANFPGAITFNALDADANRANMEVLTVVKVDTTLPATDFLLWTRGSGTTTGTENGYRAQLAFPTSGAPNMLFLVKIVAGAQTVIASTAFTFTAARSYWVRYRVNGTSLSLTVWSEDQTEPATPTLAVVDASISAAGFTGFQWGGIGKLGYVNFFSAATNGDTAVKPRTDSEYNAWLASQSAERRLLAEFSATGYDSGGSPFTKTVNAYIGNGGYTSQPWDEPPNRHYDAWMTGIPNFHREMSTALSGRATASFGTMVVSNPVQTVGTSRAGVRDDWLRMKWKRDYIKIYLGDPSWPKHDFRLFLLGRLGRPSANAEESIEFPISDLLDALAQPLQTNRYGGAAAVPSSQIPVLSGLVAWMEPVPTTIGGLEFQFHDGAIDSDPSMYDDGVSLQTASLGVSAVNAVTDTLSTATAHGGTVDARVSFLGSPAPPPPTGLSAGVDYFIIAAGLTATDFRLSATRGGAAVNITGTGIGGNFSIRGWWTDLPNGKVTLTANPAGRVVGGFVARRPTGGSECLSASVIDYLVTTKYGLSPNFKDPDSFTQLLTDCASFAGIAFYDEKISCLDALDRLCQGMNCWYGFTSDGLLQVGRLKLPTTSPLPSGTLSLKESDVIELKLLRTMMPINRATLVVQYEKRFLRSGPLNLPPNRVSGLLTEYTNVLGDAWPSAGTPLDDRPNQSEVTDYPTLASYFSLSSESPTEAARLEALYLKTLGIFQFRTRYSAMRDDVSIGSIILLEHPREGWKAWSAGDPSSPDNTSSIDSTKAVVIGIDSAPGSDSAFPVTLTVFRQIPGYYPTADLN